MEFSVSIPLDQDGFIRRECPTCRAQFKWHHGPINDDAVSSAPAVSYYCPLCGHPADVDAWLTTEQAEFVRASAMPDLLRSLESEFKGLTITDSPSAPPALTESNDMQMIVPPCHDFEPIKVPDELAGPFHCLVCGAPFAV